MSKTSSAVFVLGGPGAGKSTVANIVQTNVKNSLHIKAGQIMHTAILNDNSITQIEKTEVSDIMHHGGLVKDKIATDLLNKEIVSILSTKPDSKFILDGFPRTVDQLSGLLSKNHFNIAGVFILEAPNSIMEKRCKMRNLRTDRVDDRKGPVEHRINDFTHHIEDIRKELTSKNIPIVTIDTCETMEQMTKAIITSLQKWKL